MTAGKIAVSNNKKQQNNGRKKAPLAQAAGLKTFLEREEETL